MAQVSARRQIHAEKGLAGLDEGQEDGVIGLAPRVGLHVGERAAEQPARAVHRQLLDDIDVRHPAVIAPARIPLDGPVGEYRTLGFQHRPADDVLGGDQLDLVVLAGRLAGDGRGHLRIRLRQRRAEVAGVGLAHAARPRDQAVVGDPTPPRRGPDGAGAPVVGSGSRRWTRD